MIQNGVVVQLVWVCLPGDHYGLALHIILLLRLFRMKRVFLLIKVAFSHLNHIIVALIDTKCQCQLRTQNCLLCLNPCKVRGARQ